MKNPQWSRKIENGGKYSETTIPETINALTPLSKDGVAKERTETDKLNVFKTGDWIRTID